MRVCVCACVRVCVCAFVRSKDGSDGVGARVACRAQSLQLARTRSYLFDTKASSAGINQGLTWLISGPAQPHKNPTLGSAPRLLFRSAKDFWPPAVFFGRDSRRFSGRRRARRPAVIRAHPWAWPTALGGALWGNGARVGGRRRGAIFDSVTV